MTRSTGSLLGGLVRDGGGWLAGRVGVVARVWATAMVAPWWCFRRYLVEREQTRAIAYAVIVVGAYLLLGVALETASYPVLGDWPTASLILWFVLVALVIVPAGLHLLAFVATLVLVAIVRERATVSETVQVMAFAMSPAVFLAVPHEVVQTAVALYGALLLVYGLRVAHTTSIWRALLAGALPAYLLFGLGFGAHEALIEVLRAAYII